MISFDINKIAILNIYDADCCIIFGITKREAISILKNYDLSEESVSL